MAHINSRYIKMEYIQDKYLSLDQVGSEKRMVFSLFDFWSPGAVFFPIGTHKLSIPKNKVIVH